MLWLFRQVVVIVPALLASGCIGLPPLVLAPDGSKIAPAGPKVADLLVNLKCELWEAAHSMEELTYYEDGPGLIQHKDDPRRRTDQTLTNPTEKRRFTLHNIFQEIDYVADAEFMLEATTNNSLNPSLGFSNPYSTAIGKFPPTGVVLNVNGVISDSPHRYIQIYTSVDFSRLIDSEPNPHYPYTMEPPLANRAAHPCPDSDYRPEGTELGGQLGLKETLATGLIAAAMNDVSLSPELLAGNAKNLDASGQYTFGIIAAQVDFTINQNISGGPTWTLDHFTGPSNSLLGLINLGRQVKDTLLITFVPVCIRQQYWFDPANPDPRHRYEPEFVVGSPFWTNFLPPCHAGGNQAYLSRKTTALAIARTNNDVNRIASPSR